MFEYIGSHSLWLLLAFATATTAVWLWLNRKRLRISPWAILPLSLVHVAVGVACVKLFAIMEGAEPGAQSLFGAVFFMPLAYWLAARLFRRNVADVFDVLAVCMIFTLMCARVNCLLSGCCVGRQISPDTALRWPTREAELVYYLVFLPLAIPRVLRGDSHGQIYPLYMISYGIVRFVLEFFRVSATGTVFHLSHLWAILALCLGFGFYVETNRRLLSKTRKRA